MRAGLWEIYGLVFRISTENVINIINKLKTKSSLTAEELRTLKNALIDDEENIRVVLRVHGALRGLVRELWGLDVRKQCEAAGCLCNLALGDAKAGAVIAKAAGIYLILYLDNLTVDLSLTCAWTLGNLAGSGEKACELLVAQGAISKLSELLLSTNADVSQAAVEALVHFTYQLKDLLRPEHLTKIQAALTQNDITASTLYLMSILSCHPNFSVNNLPVQYVEKLFNHFQNNLENARIKKKELLYVLKILANFNNATIYESVFNCFQSNLDVVKMLLNSDMRNTLLQLLANMYKCYPEHELFKLLVS
ncbi:vacuolar protein 8 isoform X2 [Manduca sexta]|uniref:vacuolar protein 8 isoform X2 n=1 Tax=Manduca sexta TaxID=7130 RepID=UPI00188FBCA7|nr:vacuolar protein 8 isoform X2 [Manduca sexta]